MSNTITFDTATPRFGLPWLFTAQSQKETYINEAYAIVDAIRHCAVEGIAASPPATPEDGANWLISESASGEWAGKGGYLACRQSGGWIYVAPKDGLQLLNRSTGQIHRYLNGWNSPSNVRQPVGGTIVDAEARDAISNIITALQAMGFIS